MDGVGCLAALGVGGAVVLVVVLAGLLDMAARLDDAEERRHGVRRS
jgi:hypothetical protein